MTSAASPFEIMEAQTTEDMAAVRQLVRHFLAWVHARYPHDRALIDAYYPPEAFEALLSRLPEIHAPPKGVILLARGKSDGAPVACGMVQPLVEPGACEMKRLYVDEGARGCGLARTLCETLMGWSRRAGYRIMRLDTGHLHNEALALYRSLGFSERSAYYDVDEQWWDRMVFFERAL